MKRTKDGSVFVFLFACLRMYGWVANAVIDDMIYDT